MGGMATCTFSWALANFFGSPGRNKPKRISKTEMHTIFKLISHALLLLFELCILIFIYDYQLRWIKNCVYLHSFQKRVLNFEKKKLGTRSAYKVKYHICVCIPRESPHF